MNKILLTGGCGFIGSHCAVELLNADYEVVIVDDLSKSDVNVIKKIEEITKKKIHFHKCDVKNEDELSLIFKKHNISGVIHFAAFKSVSESVNDPIKYYDNNIVGLIKILKCMKEFGVKNFIFSSSATVYGSPKKLPIKEDEETNVLNPYGSTKLVSENILKDVSNYEDIKVISLRYFNPVGAHPTGLIGETPTGNNLFPVIMSVFNGTKNELEIYGNDYNTRDGTCVRDYIHVVDLAIGHIKALEYLNKNEIKYDVFNLGSGAGYSVLDIINKFIKISGKNIPFTYKERRPGDSQSVYADCAKAKKNLGWTCKYNMDDMISHIIKYIQQCKL